MGTQKVEVDWEALIDSTSSNPTIKAIVTFDVETLKSWRARAFKLSRQSVDTVDLGQSRIPCIGSLNGPSCANREPVSTVRVL